MSIKKISAMAIAGILVASSFTAVAQDAYVAPTTPEEALAMRKAMMRENGGVLRSAGSLSGAEAVAAMQTLHDNFSHIPDVFPEGSIVGDSEALPAIWENWEDFTAIAETGRQAAADAIAAAEAGDSAAYAAALKTLGGTCGQCHQQFRS
ncbi:MAG TPA: cytochrome c [Devosia sp.]|jgi:cytochrome c556|nr:cytochrome c [Devosia sp.]